MALSCNMYTVASFKSKSIFSRVDRSREGACSSVLQLLYRVGGQMIFYPMCGNTLQLFESRSTVTKDKKLTEFCTQN